MFKSKFVFAVSFVALFAVGSAWAVDSDAGIAGVSYVDRLLSDKQDKLTANNVTTTGTTGVVKAVVGDDGKLSVTKSAVAVDDIAASAVTTPKIAASAVTTAKIADSNVTTAKIANGTIVDEDIAAGANIAQSKIAGLGNALAAKEDVSNKANQVTEGMNKAQMYPTVSLTESLIAGANQDMSELIGAVDDDKTVVEMITEGDNAKQDKLNATNVTTTGTTGVVKAVVGDDGKLSVTKSAVAADDIAASAVTTAKIADGNVTTAKIAANAVTVAKTTGIYGYIPTASNGTGSAQIWVE